MFKINIRLFKSLKEKRITLASWFTIARIVMTPFIMAAMTFDYWKSAFSLFVIAGFTDLLDGKLARYYNQTSLLGACLDPVADKILILGCLFTLACIPSQVFHLPLWFVVMILLRELIVIGGVVVLYFLKGIIQIQPTLTSKITTFFQILFIVWIFACYFFHWLPIKTYYGMLSLVTVLVIVSLIQYIRIGFAVLTMEVS